MLTIIFKTIVSVDISDGEKKSYKKLDFLGRFDIVRGKVPSGVAEPI
jgi:hypothetical protein